MKETVYDFSNLQELFNGLDKRIRNFRRSQEAEGYNKEALVQKKEALLRTAQNISIRDLTLLYYVKGLDRDAACKILRLLKNMYRAKMELHNTLQGDEKRKNNVYP
ncbi:MAG: hypothetical protein IKA20_02765 [Clostridia bacterium]|nr:hypothetical protein [Clostridia bacterium]